MFNKKYATALHPATREKPRFLYIAIRDEAPRMAAQTTVRPEPLAA